MSDHWTLMRQHEAQAEEQLRIVGEGKPREAEEAVLRLLGAWVQVALSDHYLALHRFLESKTVPTDA